MLLGLYIITVLVVVIGSRDGIPTKCTDACKRRTAGTYKLGNSLPIPGMCQFVAAIVVAPKMPEIPALNTTFICRTETAFSCPFIYYSSTEVN
jgi:hypothetical protein